MTETKHLQLLGRLPDELDKRLMERRRCITQRCGNPNHPNYNVYGARGITMAQEFRDSPKAWCDYLRGLPGASPDLTIDRIDPDKNYERGNLRWADRKTQSRNLRTAIRVGGESARDIADREFPEYNPEWIAKLVASGRSLDELRDKPRKAWSKTWIKIQDGDEVLTAREFCKRYFEGGHYPIVVELARKGLSKGEILEGVASRRRSPRL